MFSLKAQSVLVWTYHRVLPGDGNASVSVDTFRAQLKYLLENGYHFLDTEEIQLWKEGKLDPARKYTMLTFDDGWADNLFCVTPILAEFSIRAVLALNTGLIDLDNGDSTVRTLADYKIKDSKQALGDSIYGIDKTSFITKSELLEMKKSGVWDIQPHGNSHVGCYENLNRLRGFYPDKKHWTMEYALGGKPFDGAPRCEFKSTLAQRRTVIAPECINRLRKASTDEERKKICNAENAIILLENEKEFAIRVAEDMKFCRSFLQDEIGVTSRGFFWPWGHYSDESIRIASELDFKQLYTMDKGPFTRDSSLLKIPRIAAPAKLKRFVHQEKVFSNTFLYKARAFFNRFSR